MDKKSLSESSSLTISDHDLHFEASTYKIGKELEGRKSSGLYLVSSCLVTQYLRMLLGCRGNGDGSNCGGAGGAAGARSEPAENYKDNSGFGITNGQLRGVRPGNSNSSSELLALPQAGQLEFESLRHGTSESWRAGGRS